MLVVDSSILVSSLLPDETGPDLEALFEAHDELLAPCLLWAELRNVLVVGERRGRLSMETSDALLDAIDDLGIVLDQTPSNNVMQLARRHGLSVYDALYLELAIRRDAQLATLDGALLRAAQAESVSTLRAGTISKL